MSASQILGGSALGGAVATGSVPGVPYIKVSDVSTASPSQNLVLHTCQPVASATGVIVDSDLNNASTSLWLTTQGDAILPPAWNAAQAYTPNVYVTYAGNQYISSALQPNLNQQPDVSPAYWLQVPAQPYSSSYRWSVAGATGGGLNAGELQLFSYIGAPNETTGFDFEGYALRIGSPGNADRNICYINRGSLDPTRTGVTPALVNGANAVACPSVTAGSVVRLRIAGTAAAGGFPAAAIPLPIVTTTPGTGFSVACIAGVHTGIIYDYEVIG